MSIHLGRFEFPRRDESPMETIAYWDNLIGQPSGTHRHYLSITGSWAGSFSQWGFEHNRIGVYSIEPRDENKNPLKWVDVANGKFDSHIESSATELLSLMEASGCTVPAYTGWHHEPENEEVGKGTEWGVCGTRDECKAAGERFLGIVQRVMGARCRIGQTLMAGSYASGRYTQWLPSNCWWVGVDAYSHGNELETFGKIVTPAHVAAMNTGRKLVIQELGAEEVQGDSMFKANFFHDARNLIKTWKECRIAEYSNVVAKGDYTVNSSGTSPQALTAFKLWASDPYYKGAWT